LVRTAPLPAAVYTPLAFDCQNDTRAPTIGKHDGDSTTPVSTCPVPIFARNGAVPRSGPPLSFGVSAHRAAGAAPTLAAEQAAMIQTTQAAPMERIAQLHATDGHQDRATQRRVDGTAQLSTGCNYFVVVAARAAA
jgi:hypothetical protein